MKYQDEVLLNYSSREQYNHDQLIPNAKTARRPLKVRVNALIQSQ